MIHVVCIEKNDCLPEKVHQIAKRHGFTVKTSRVLGGVYFHVSFHKEVDYERFKALMKVAVIKYAQVNFAGMPRVIQEELTW